MAEFRLRWTMTATHAEVVRGLPPELRAASVIEGARIRGAQGERRWEIELAPPVSRRAGPIELPVTEVDIRLWGYSEAERESFIARLEQCARRGGG